MMENFNKHMENIRFLLSLPLPGEKAQFLMEPSSRKIELQKQIKRNLPQISSILILLYPHQNKLKTIMIKRPIYDGVHSGQISFPGGKFEKQDLNLVDTALRESWEEIGIPKKSVNILGSITELYIPPSNFNVLPVIGYTNKRPEFKISKIEVDKILEINIEDFLNKKNIRQKEILSHNNIRLSVPCYFIQDEIIWGASAMILSEFIEILKKNTKIRNYLA
jgi:8-oxo-dGTP pyrophosphatase MutT (NUDIX family)